MVHEKALIRGLLLGCLLGSVLALPSVAGAVTPASALTDREIAERLTRLETRLDEGLKGLREEMAQLRTDMIEQNRQLRTDMIEQNRLLREDMGQLRDDMNIRFEEQGRQNRQLRTDMNIRFEEQGRMLLGIVAAFAALIAVNIGLVVWDRRTAARPFEDKVAGIAEELSENRSRVSTLLKAFRALGQQNQTVAAVLKRFNLL